MAKTLKRLYDAERDGVIARSDDLYSLRTQTSDQIDAVRNECRQHADKQFESVRAEVQVLQEHSATKKQLDDLRALLVMDSRNYSKECAVEATRQAKMALDSLDLREEAARAAMKAELLDGIQNLQDQQNELKQALEAVRENFRDRMTSQKDELMSVFESIKDSSIDNMVTAIEEAKVDVHKAREMATSRVKELDDCLQALQSETHARLQHAMEDAREQRERQDSQFGQVASRLEEQINQGRVHADDSLLSFRKEAEGKMLQMESDVGTLQENVAEALNQCTQSVEWLIPDVAQRLKNSKSRSCFSPKFGAGGESGLQLELQAVRPSDKSDDGHESGDCVLNIWSNKRVKLVFRLSLGTVSTPSIEHEFNGWEPYRSRRIWFLDDQIKQDDGSLRLAVDLLEASRTIEQCAGAGPSSPKNARPALSPQPIAAGSGLEGVRAQAGRVQEEGTLILNRNVNNRVVEDLQNAVQVMRSHMLRRVEWRLEHASTLRACYAEGQCICSNPFVAAGIDGIQLVFYPSGYAGVRQGYCSLFLTRPSAPSGVAPMTMGCGQTLQAWLRIGKQRWEALPAPELPHFHGRVNFCRFDHCVDQTTDTVLLVLEIQEAPQDFLEVGAQQDPWRNPPLPTGGPRGASPAPKGRSRRPHVGIVRGAASRAPSSKPPNGKNGQADSVRSTPVTKPAVASESPRPQARDAFEHDSAPRPATAPAEAASASPPRASPSPIRRPVVVESLPSGRSTDSGGGTGEAGDTVGSRSHKPAVSEAAGVSDAEPEGSHANGAGLSS